jgi:hypothetical protein
VGSGVARRVDKGESEEFIVSWGDGNWDLEGFEPEFEV